MQVEHHFADLSCYPKNSDTATPIDDVEWFAKNIGITNLDDPSVKVRTIIDDVNESELARQKAKQARESKAQDEFLDAMFNLDSGTAVLRQKSERTKPAAKPKTVKVAKTVKPISTAKSKRQYYVKRPVNPKTLAIAARRAAMIKTLKEGGTIESVGWREDDIPAHQQQYHDLRQIAKKESLNIVRATRVQTNSSGFRLDNFERYPIDAPISCLLDGPDKNTVLAAICSGKVLAVSDIKEDNKHSARMIATLARRYGFDIYSLTKGGSLVGWVLIEEPKSDDQIKKQAEAANLGGALQGMNYLKLRAEIRQQMPDASADEINEATWIEYKRVYSGDKNYDACKEGQGERLAVMNEQ